MYGVSRDNFSSKQTGTGNTLGMVKQIHSFEQIHCMNCEAIEGCGNFFVWSTLG